MGTQEFEEGGDKPIAAELFIVVVESLPAQLAGMGNGDRSLQNRSLVRLMHDGSEQRKDKGGIPKDEKSDPGPAPHHFATSRKTRAPKAITLTTIGLVRRSRRGLSEERASSSLRQITALHRAQRTANPMKIAGTL